MSPERTRWLCVVFTLALTLTLTPRAARAAWPHDSTTNLPLCTAAGNQANPASVSDGAGGAIVAWQDGRTLTNFDIYAQHVSASGAARWSPDGVPICTASGTQQFPNIVSDGAGGAIIVWQDFRSATNFDIYAQHLNAAGVPQWTANGVALCTAAGHQQFPTLTSDGAGGAIVAWQDLRGGPKTDIYAQRISVSGVPLWTADGVALCVATDDQIAPTIVSDGAGGAFVTWQDLRGGVKNDIYAQRVNAAGVPQWTADGAPVCLAVDDQYTPIPVTDGAGGAIITWRDYRNGVNDDVYAQRLNPAGVPQWTLNGVPISVAASNQSSPTIVADGAGGAIITWRDYRGDDADIYAQRVDATGTPQWTLDGVALCLAIGDQLSPTIVSDGEGGAIVTWRDNRNGTDADIYSQCISAAGLPQWSQNGVALCTCGNNQLNPTVVPDGIGGAIVTWQDFRDGIADIYTQRIERFGQLGNPEPAVASVLDVPNDQGGTVNLTWSASYLDVSPAFGISSYAIWRRTTPAPTWQLLGSVTANGSASYNFSASTLGDSTPVSLPYTVFRVDAHSANGSAIWSSYPDSGYSVDNLSPAMPTPFSGTYSAGTSALHWGRNTESDFAGYRLYRGSWPGFVPGPSTLIASKPDTGFVDPAGALYCYKLTALDVHGNESAWALAQPTGTVDAPNAAAIRELWLGGATPNPMQSAAAIRFGLPHDARISLTIFDQQGRRVRALITGSLPAGEHAAFWDGRDESARVVASGIYFLRLEAEGRTLTARFAAIR